MKDLSSDRVELANPVPMIPPAVCAVTGVCGDEIVKDDLIVLWTFVVSAEPPQVGISIPEILQKTGEPFHTYEFLKKHGEFTLNILDSSYINQFDIVDMSSSQKTDKFALSGLTKCPSKTIKAPGIAEAAIILECWVSAICSVPVNRAIIIGEVLRTTIQQGVVDGNGRLIPKSREFIGMLTGCGEFWTFGKKVGHIGQTKGRDDIRY